MGVVYEAEDLTLGRRVWARVQKENHLVFGQKFQVQVVPIRGGLEGKAMLHCHAGKPPVCLSYETDVRLVALACVEGNHPVSRRIRLREGS